MTTTAKYIKIAQQVIADIDKEQLKVNAKLPSLRTFCHLHHISMTTAIACYRYLEHHGYAIAENKKGYFVQKPHLPETTVHFPVFESTVTTQTTRPQFNSQELTTFSLATAQLDESLIDYQLLKRSLRAVTKYTDFTVRYDDVNGNLRLRQQLASHFSKQGFPCAEQELIITHGCLDAVLIALECISKPGDVIAVCSPCYSGLLDILSLLGRAVLEIPSTEHGLAIEQLEEAMRNKQISACLLTANYQNPTGHCLSNQQKQDIVSLASEHQIPIIEDDVYRELSHQRTTPLPMKYFDQHGWVIWCSSISKTLAPGLRIGWCLPGKFKAAFAYQRKVRTLGHNQPVQLALADYIANGYYDKHLKKVNKALSSHYAEYIQYLQRHLPDDSELLTPHGGLVLWIRIPQLDTEKLAIELVKQKIHIKPGNVFSTTSLYQDCFRINIGLSPTKEVLSQLDVICQLAHSLELT